MRLRKVIAGALGLGLLLVASASNADASCRLIRGAATPDDTSDDVEVCRADTWLHGGGTKLGNLGGAGQGTIPTWDATPPTASMKDGGGSGYAQVRFVEILSPRDKTVMPTMAGEFTGVLDNLAATIYISCPAYQASGTPYPMSVALTIDGEPIVDKTALDAYVEVPITPVDSHYGFMKVAFTNLHASLTSVGLDNDATTKHTIEIQFMNQFWVDGNAVMLYDATEVPTGQVFNIETNKLGPFTKIDTNNQV